MDEKALVVVAEQMGGEIVAVESQNTALVGVDSLPDFDIPGLDDMGREDMSVPKVVLVQAQSKNVPDLNAKIGKFYNRTTGETRDVFTGVMIGIAKFRFCRDKSKQFDIKDKPLCASDDGLYPRPQFVGTVVMGTKITGNPCAQCPFAKFGDNGEAPYCPKGYGIAFLDADSEMPILMALAKTSAKAAKAIVTITKMVKARKLISMSSVFVQKDKGSWWEPVPFIAGDTPTGLYNLARMAAGEGNLAKRLDLSELEELAGDSTGDASDDNVTEGQNAPPPTEEFPF